MGTSDGMKLSLHAQTAFTLIEMVVAMALGMLILGMAVSTTISNRELYETDSTRLKVNQNLRAALDFMGLNVREAGENLSASFTAIEIIDGQAGPDELIIRRNLKDEVLKLCVDLAAGSTVQDVLFATSGTTPGCIYSDNTHNYSVWRDYRLQSEAQEVKAYIYDASSGLGEFFTYDSESDNGFELSIHRKDGSWANNYSSAATAIYILEEWRFRLNGDVLELIENSDFSAPQGIVYGIEDFQVSAIENDGTVKQAFGSNDDWTALKAIRVTLLGDASYRGNSIARSATAEFFPRNILSN
ncbi:MAG: hypothetical protein D6719_13380 [Candidatus Dadabacteria bacterium]|nr:MAG: hypothetical protein D6719_13380 [Candidatus Dadabacteria bacterium]